MPAANTVNAFAVEPVTAVAAVATTLAVELASITIKSADATLPEATVAIIPFESVIPEEASAVAIFAAVPVILSAAVAVIATEVNASNVFSDAAATAVSAIVKV